MRVLVLGGTGFIGSNLVAALGAAGHRARLFHRPDSSLANLEGLQYEVVSGEFCSDAALERAMEGVDGVVNLVACGDTGPEARAARIEVNVEGAARVAAVARRAGARLLHVSSVAAVGFPEEGEVADESLLFNRHSDHFAMTKWEGEAAVLREVAQGLHAMIVCPGNVVGRRGMREGQRANFRKIADGELRVYPPGGVSLTGVVDLAEGMVRCLERGRSGERYILAGENVTFRDYFAGIAEATGGRAPRIRLPRSLLLLAGWGVERLMPLLGRRPFIDTATVEMVCRNLYYSSEKARRELGYRISPYTDVLREAAKAL